MDVYKGLIGIGIVLMAIGFIGAGITIYGYDVGPAYFVPLLVVAFIGILVFLVGAGKHM